MQQHPVPQNITSYQFRLIGDMTLKQFLQLLGGGAVAFIFFSTNLPGIIKWFFVIVSVAMGAAFAFLPLEGRPLDQWLLAFIRAIYKPTQFHWKKDPQLPDYLSDEPIIKTTVPVPQINTKKPEPAHETQLNQQEDKRVDQLNRLFSTTPAAPTSQSPAPQSIPAPTKTPVPDPKPQPKLTPPPQKPQSTPPPQNRQGIQKTSTPQRESIKVETKPIEQIKVAANKPVAPPPKAELPTPQLGEQQPTIDPKLQGTIIPNNSNDKPTTTAKLNPDLPFPSLPETKNTLVGMVFNKDGKIIDNAIIEIQNDSHHTVRATKTNKLGQFFLATPLDNGSYFIKIERDGFQFSVISLKLEDKIYPPIEIRSLN